MRFVRLFTQSPSHGDDAFQFARIARHAREHTLRMCLCTATLALGILMAGSGSVSIMALCRCDNLAELSLKASPLQKIARATKYDG